MFSKKQKFISLKEAAKLTGYAPDYIGSLIRTKKIRGKKIYSGVSWFITEEDLKEYQQRMEAQKSKSNKKWKAFKFISDNFSSANIPIKIKETAKKIAGIRQYKNKKEKIFSFSWRFILLIMIFLSFIGIGPLEILNKIVGALTGEEKTMNLYSVTCTGDWLNPQNAQGQPEAGELGDFNSFSESNSAVYKGGPLNLLCQDFQQNTEEIKNEEPGNLKIQSAKIKFSFAIDEKKPDLEINQTPITEEPEQPAEEPLAPAEEPEKIKEPLAPNEEQPPLEIPQTPAEEPAAPIEEPAAPAEEPGVIEITPETILPLELMNSSFSKIPSIEKNKQPAGFLNKIKKLFGIKAVKAQEEDAASLETETPPIETITLPIDVDAVRSAIEISDNSVEKISTPNLDSKIIIWYSFDSETWFQLTTISEQPLSNFLNGGYFSYEAPFLKSWDDVNNLKIKFEGVIGGETNTISYLDAIWLEINYNKQEEKTEETENIQKPKIKIKDSSLIIPQKEKNFSSNEEPTFIITEPNLKVEELINSEKGEIIEENEIPKENETPREEEKSILEKVKEKLLSFINKKILPSKVGAQTTKIKAKIFGPDGLETNILPEINSFLKNGEEVFELKIPKIKREFKPGLYKLEIEFEAKDAIYVLEQDFTWGVLAINTNRSIYLSNQGAYIQMGVLRDDGHTICNASLELQITSPKSEIQILTTKDGTIQYSSECGPNNVTDVPDYFVYYQVGESGIYEMKLINLDNNYEITDSFEVRDSVPFDIERIGPTRIYPPVNYEMKFKIKVNQDFVGEVVETVPASFEIIETSDFSSTAELTTGQSKRQETRNEEKLIIWDVNWKEGESYELIYQFDAPDISPYLYLLGPLEIGDFKEIRQWQVAADILSTKYPTVATTAAVSPYDDEAWTGMTNVYSDDGSYASITSTNFDLPDQSQVLKAVHFDFAIPTATTILGIRVEIEKYDDELEEAVDVLVQLTKDNTAGVGDNKKSAAAWATTPTIASYGGSIDLWGTTWSAAEINADTFGVWFAAQAQTANSDIYVDYIRVNVSYTLSNGQPCTSSTECTSGFCTDNYCCNGTCSGACNRCNVAGSLGTCTDVNSDCAGSVAACYCSSGTCQSCPDTYGLCGEATCSSYSCGNSAYSIGTDCGAFCQSCNGSGACINTANGSDYQTECPGAVGTCAGLNCNGAGNCQYLTVGQQGCGACKYCTGASYSCSNVAADSDPYGGCTGNCDECSGAGACRADAATFCTGNCDICSGSGTAYNCAADNTLCANTDASCNCSGSGTVFNCQSCGQCSNCSAYSCGAVTCLEDTTGTTCSSTNVCNNAGTCVAKTANDGSCTVGSCTACNPSTSCIFCAINYCAANSTCGPPTITVSGNAYDDEGADPIDGSSTNKTVNLRVNGAGSYTDEITTSDGAWSISSVTAASGAIITIYLNDETEEATIVYVSDGTNQTNVNLYKNRVIVRADTGSITNANLLTGDDTDDDIKYNVSGSDLTVDDGFELHILDGDTFAPGGLITTSPASSQSSTDGDIHIDGTAVLSAGGTISCGGDWTNEGTFTHNNNGATFTGTTTGFVITDGGENFYNVTFNGSGGGWSFADSTTIDVDLTMTAGTLSGTNSITVNGGDVTGDGTITLTGGTFLLDAAGNFGGDTAWTFFNLTFGDGADITTTTKTGTGAMTVSNVLTIAASQVLDAGDDTWTLSGTGTPFVKTGNFTPNASTLVYTGVTDATNITSTTYYNLNIGGSTTTTTYTAAGDITVSNVLTIVSSSGINTFDASSYTITLSGTTGTPFVNNETFTHSTSIVQYTGANAGGNTNVVAIDYYDLKLNAVDTFDAAGNIEVSDVFTIQHASAIFDAKVTTVTLSGTTGTPFVITGTFTGSTSTFIYTGDNAGGSTTITASANYCNLQINHADENYVLGGTTTLSGDFTATLGTLSESTDTLTVNGGDITGNGTITFTGGTVLLDTAGNFGGDTAWTFYNLTFGNGADVTTTTKTGTGAITVSNVLTIAASQVLDAGDDTWTLSGSGTPFVKTGTFTANASTFQYTASTGGGLNWLSGWDKRVKLTIDQTDIDADLTGFPVLIYLGTSAGRNAEDISFVFDELTNDENRKKIAVTKSDGTTELYVEIEKWVDASETAWLWVSKSDWAISGTVDTDLYLYYDADHANNTTYVGDIDSSPAYNVWDSNFVGVWHMDTTSPVDSTNNNDLTVGGTVAAESGQIANVSHYDGSTGRQVKSSPTAALTLTNNFSIELWTKPDVLTQANRYLLSKVNAAGVDNYYSVVWEYVDNNVEFYSGLYTGTAPRTGSQIAIADTNWHHIVYDYNGSTWEGFKDGANVFTTSRTFSLNTTEVGNLVFANFHPTTASWCFDGTFDEIRISNASRSDAWIKATYETGRDDLLDFGSEETAVVNLVTAANYNNLEVKPSANGMTYTLASGTVKTDDYLTVGNGTNTGTLTADTNDPTLNVDGAFTIAANGTFIASNSGSFTIAGNFSNSGTFTHSSGTVTFDGAGISELTYTAATTFYNFTVATAGKAMEFDETDQTNVAGLFNIQGTNCTTGRVFLDSTTNDNQWDIYVSGSTDIDYADVEDSRAVTTALTAENSTADNNSNTNWTINAGACGGITVSGTSDLSSGTVAVAVNAALQTGKTGTISGGNWSIASVSVSSGNIVTVWVDGATDANESTGVGKYDGSGDMTGMVLNQHVLSIGSVDDQSLTVTNLGQYDNDDDEDIMHSANSSVLNVDDDNAYTDEKIDILSGDTLTISGTETLTTHDLDINGTLVSGGAGTFNISGAWNNDSVFTASSETINFTSTTSENMDFQGSSDANSDINSAVFNGSGGAWSLTTALIVNGDLTTTAGTISGTNGITVSGGDITGTNGSINMTGGTVTLSGTGNLGPTSTGTYTFSSLTFSGTTTAVGDFTVSSVLTISDTYSLDASSKTITLSGTGTPFVKTGTFTQNTSTVKYTGNGDTNITVATYNNLEFSPTITDDRVYTGAGAITVGGTLNLNPSATAKSLTFNLGGTTSVTGATTIQRTSTATSVLDTVLDSNHSFTTGSLTIKAGGTLNGRASALDSNGDITIEASGTLTSTSGNFNVGGSWSNSATGVFTHSSGTVIFDATTAGKTISDGGDPFYGLQFTGNNGGWTYTDGASTAPNSTTVNCTSCVANFINAKTATSPTVTAGTLNVDWYLGVHAADAVTESHIETGASDITISTAGASSWLSGWDKRIKLTIDQTDIDADLTNLPVLVYLSTSSGRNSDDVSAVFDELTSDANRKKIAVTKSDGTTELYVEIEKWDDANEKAWLWVSKSDWVISGTTNTDFYLYYDVDHADNTTYVGDTNSTPAETVWDTNYKGVWHLNESSGTRYDSTSNSNDGTLVENNGTVTYHPVAKIGGGLEFDGSAQGKHQYIEVDDDDSLHLGQGSGEYALEAWVYTNNQSTNYKFVTGKDNQASTLNYNLYIANKLVTPLEWGGTGPTEISGTTPLAATTWYYITARVDGTDKYAYFNGASENSTTRNVQANYNTGTLRIGGDWWPNDGVDGQTFNGIIDEVRVSSVARSAAWIKAGYETGRDDLLDFGSEETSTQMAIWRHDGDTWGSAGSSQTTGTDSDGNNPQPTSAGAILIREYSNTAGTPTYYLYNLQITWQSTYGEYDYYSDYGSNYLTSTANSGANKDAVIGVDWYRALATIGTMNAVGTINEPPTNGSWYCGLQKGLEVTITGTSIDFGTLDTSNSFSATAGTQTQITVTTSTVNGYIVTAWETQLMKCSDAGACATETIPNFTYGTYADPQAWSGLYCKDNANYCGFGFTSSDDDVGGEDRYSPTGTLEFTYFPTDSSAPVRVMDYPGPISNKSFLITYRISASLIQRPGPYGSTIVYVVTAQY